MRIATSPSRAPEGAGDNIVVTGPLLLWLIPVTGRYRRHSR